MHTRLFDVVIASIWKQTCPVNDERKGLIYTTCGGRSNGAYLFWENSLKAENRNEKQDGTLCTIRII